MAAGFSLETFGQNTNQSREDSPLGVAISVTPDIGAAQYYARHDYGPRPEPGAIIVCELKPRTKIWDLIAQPVPEIEDLATGQQVQDFFRSLRMHGVRFGEDPYHHEIAIFDPKRIIVKGAYLYEENKRRIT